METEDYLEISDEEQNEDFIENPDTVADASDEEPTGNNEDRDNEEENNNEGDQNNESGKKPVKKRVVLNPRPKLDAARLCGNKGIPILPQLFAGKKFKGKGYEREDLDYMMSKLEHWGHRLFPTMTFDTLLSAIEKLGAKKPVQVVIKKMRLDMPVLDNDFVTQRDEDDDQPAENIDNENQDPISKDDAFEELLRSRKVPNVVDKSDSVETRSPTSSVAQKTITDEMRERMERNRQLAVEKRRLRQLQQQESPPLQEDGDSSNKNLEVLDINDSQTASNAPEDTATIHPNSQSELRTDNVISDSPTTENVQQPNVQAFDSNESQIARNAPENTATILPNSQTELRTSDVTEDVDSDSPTTENVQPPTALLTEDELLSEMWGESS